MPAVQRARVELKSYIGTALWRYWFAVVCDFYTSARCGVSKQDNRVGAVIFYSQTLNDNLSRAHLAEAQCVGDTILYGIGFDGAIWPCFEEFLENEYPTILEKERK